ncbi:uncharacterized protein WM277_012769 [Molossus nigricans]
MSRTARACAPPPRPSPQPRSRRRAVASPAQPGAARFEDSRRGAARASVTGAVVGLCEGRGGKPGVERPPPARRPGSRRPRGSGGTWRARARPRTCPRGPRAPAEPLPLPGRSDGPSLMVCTAAASWEVSRGARRAAQTRY